MANYAPSLWGSGNSHETRSGHRNWDTKEDLYYIQEKSLQYSQIWDKPKIGLGRVWIESGQSRLNGNKSGKLRSQE